MSGSDKARNKLQNLTGKGKEVLGRVTGDRGIERKGRRDQTKSNIKDAGENVKDATRHSH